MNIGKIIYGLRQHKKWSQRELAEKAEVSEALISIVENNVVQTSHKTLVKIAAAFGCPVAFIYMWSTESADFDDIAQKEFFTSVKHLIHSYLDLTFNTRST